MRLLQLHCDHAAYKAEKKALKKGFEEVPIEQRKRHEYRNVLVVFVSLEAGDGSAEVKQASQAIQKHFAEVKAERILLYPYAHLSSHLASPSDAVPLLGELHAHLKAFADCDQSPFGWYKSFEVQCKGHPLSELSKTIGGDTRVSAPKKEEEVSTSLKQEADVKSRFFIFSPDGKLIPASEFNYSGHEHLKRFADYEIKKVRTYAQEPPHIRLMKEHQLVDYEPASDSGHFRWLPNGLVIKRLLERYVTRLLVDYGAMQVETPIMYDYAHPALKKYLHRFPARQYTVKSDNKDFFLRFSACFGQFLAMHDATITYKHLPLRFYELTHYSFRREQSGELAGLKRLRAFSMPDMHSLVSHLDMAKEEFERQYHLCMNWNLDLGIPFETAFRAQKDFFESNKEWYRRMVEKIGKPMLFEIFDERYAYFITKFEMNFVDNAHKASGLSTVQIDVENGKTFDITFIDAKGRKQHPLILHASIPGAIERVVFALLEQAARHIREGKTPMLPLWLAPTQVRLIPVSDKHVEYGTKVLQSKAFDRVRIDLDDRSETLQKKVRDAERDWVPYVAVVGDQEMASQQLAVRVRSTKAREMLSADQLGNLVRDECFNKPFEPLSLHSSLSKRPTF
ncbi:threonine--tRNA ligase [Candidatus Micrarchaeota archaeon]|nr:threonine--tRNA ligase [Candidatus Micrarchaeota archaeon]